MKFVIIACALIVVVKAAVIAPLLTTIPLRQSAQYHSQDTLGQYVYGYANDLTAKNEFKTIDGQTVGAYSYIDGEGKIQNVQYRADPTNGFHVSATNLPIAPALPEVVPLKHPEPVSDTAEVIEARSKHLEAFKAVENEAKKLLVTSSAPALQPSAVEIKSAPTTQLNILQPGSILATPAFSYSYGINHNGIYAYSSLPGQHLLTYHTPSATLISAPLSNDILIANQQQQSLLESKDKPEIVAARTEIDTNKIKNDAIIKDGKQA